MNRTISTFLAALAVTFAVVDGAAAAEPTVAEVRRAALRYAGLDRRPDRWSARARWRHLLPRLQATAGRIDQVDDNVQFDEWLTHDGDASLLYDSARNQNEDNHRSRGDFTLRATVDLNGLLFDDAELAAAREERARLDARRELVAAVHAAYFEHLAALDALRAATPGERRAKALRVRQLEARLDGLTGGWYAQRRGEP